MKNLLFIPTLFFVIFLTSIITSCSSTDENSRVEVARGANTDSNSIVFEKSAASDWKNKKVEVSFEDAFQKFSPIDAFAQNGKKVGYGLSNNNLKQGLTIKIKVSDSITSSEKINEIMVEGFDLEKGINEFTIGCNENKAYIIY